MNVEIGTEAAKFSEKEYVNGIFMQCRSHNNIPKMLYIKIPDIDLLKAFEEEVFSLELVKPDGIDHEDGIVVDILEAGEGDEHLPVIIIIIYELARKHKPMLHFY
jgi:hypothetical protein